MDKAWALMVVALSTGALAKPWNGVEPGVTPKAEVIKRFGEPVKTTMLDGKEVIAYMGTRAIPGTTEAQFRIDPKSHAVERIDVFPALVIEKDTVESTYGPACPPQGQAAPLGGACFQKRLTEDFRTYYLYPRLGLAVFFNEDGATVQSFTFQAPKGSDKAG